jgi:hypothetical protein
MVILQVQSIAKTWREVGRCQNNPQIVAGRLDQLVERYKKPARAIDAHNSTLIDMRLYA